MTEIFKLLYLGDSFCEQFLIENGRIAFQINCISFLKGQNCNWDFDTSNDVLHGYLVFEGVSEYVMDTLLPFNDEIYEIEMLEKKNERYIFAVYGSHISDCAVSTDIQIRINCEEFYVTDSNHNRLKINNLPSC